uniref:Zinc finger family protein n=1 Tax=Solanum tuberosum TaxID=4113 RepID=M1C3C6_SOLTU
MCTNINVLADLMRGVMPKNLVFLQLQLQAIYSIMVASVLGFGATMSINAMYIRYYSWRFQIAENSSPA